MNNAPLLPPDPAELTDAEQYRAQLLSDRLTAEFQSPLNSGNLRRKLRPARGGADLFGTEPTQERLL